MTNLDLRESVAQILQTGSDIVVGTGFVVADQFVITCAHVIESARCKPGDRIKLVFQLNGESRIALVLAEAWRSPQEQDIAILQLEDKLIDPIKALVLSSAVGCEGHPFRAFGYAQVGDIEGVWATGEIKGIVKQTDGRQLLQLASSELDRGISGSPVLDLARERVVGMITTVYYPYESTKYRDTAFATTAENIHDTFSALPLEPVPLAELFKSRRGWFALTNKQVWAVLWMRLRLLVVARPVLATLVLLAIALASIAAVKMTDEWLNRNWVRIDGGSALLCNVDPHCSWTTAPFEMQITEVTNQDYFDCVQNKRCDPPGGVWRIEPGGWTFPAEFAQHPVFIPMWDDANRYCQFIGARLPTEAEWILAARGGTTQDYPWGNEFDTSKANVFESNKGITVAVNEDPGASTQPIHHIIGNVREWVDGAINPSDRTSGFGAPIVKGGSYMDKASNSTIWTRFQDKAITYSGVRCARGSR